MSWAWTRCTRLPSGSSTDQGLYFCVSGGCGRTALVAGALKVTVKHVMVFHLSAFALAQAPAQADIGKTYGRGARYRPEQIRRRLWHTSGGNVESDCGDKEAANSFLLRLCYEELWLARIRTSILMNRTHNMPTKFTNEILAAAIEGFQAQKQRLDAQIAELRQLLTGGSVEPAAAPEPMRKRRKMSAAARQRIAEAQRKRWAAAKKESGVADKTAKPVAKKPKRKLSAAGRQRIIDATKKRWAAVRAAASKAAK